VRCSVVQGGATFSKFHELVSSVLTHTCYVCVCTDTQTHATVCACSHACALTCSNTTNISPSCTDSTCCSALLCVAVCCNVFHVPRTHLYQRDHTCLVSVCNDTQTPKTVCVCACVCARVHTCALSRAVPPLTPLPQH